MMYLRHEAGMPLIMPIVYSKKQNGAVYSGDFRSHTGNDYQTVPFSARFVRHIPGWYAQKHPDEDFAETFAVWLTPGSDWQKEYTDTPALVNYYTLTKLCKNTVGSHRSLLKRNWIRPSRN